MTTLKAFDPPASYSYDEVCEWAARALLSSGNGYTKVRFSIGGRVFVMTRTDAIQALEAARRRNSHKIDSLRKDQTILNGLLGRKRNGRGRRSKR